MVSDVATHRYPHGRVGLASQARRQQTASHRSSEELWQSTLVRVIRITLEVLRRSGKASTLRRALHTARRPEIVRHCSRAFALLGWMLLSLRSCSPFTWLPLPRESAPRLALQAEDPDEASLSLLLRGLCSLTRARASCAAGQSALLFVIMLALTLASSTPAPCPLAPFATLVTSRRRVHDRRRREALFITESSSSSSSPGVLLPLSARGLTRDQSSRRVPSHPLRSR